jgi:hypothetical protein
VTSAERVLGEHAETVLAGGGAEADVRLASPPSTPTARSANNRPVWLISSGPAGLGGSGNEAELAAKVFKLV